MRYRAQGPGTTGGLAPPALRSMPAQPPPPPPSQQRSRVPAPTSRLPPGLLPTPLHTQLSTWLHQLPPLSSHSPLPGILSSSTLNYYHATLVSTPRLLHSVYSSTPNPAATTTDTTTSTIHCSHHSIRNSSSLESINQLPSKLLSPFPLPPHSSLCHLPLLDRTITLPPKPPPKSLPSTQLSLLHIHSTRYSFVSSFLFSRLLYL